MLNLYVVVHAGSFSHHALSKYFDLYGLNRSVSYLITDNVCLIFVQLWAKLMSDEIDRKSILILQNGIQNFSELIKLLLVNVNKHLQCTCQVG